MIVLIVTIILASVLWITMENMNRRKLPPDLLKLLMYGNSLQISLADKLTGNIFCPTATRNTPRTHVSLWLIDNLFN